MPSFQFRILRSLIKYKFSQKDSDSGIDLNKARLMDTPEPPRRFSRGNPKLNPIGIPRSFTSRYTTRNNRGIILEKQVLSGRNIFHLYGSKQENSKVLLYLHGGAFISGITKIYWNFSKQLASSLRCRIIMPEYPLAPESSYQETSNFILELYRQLLIEHNPESINVLGDSAGGNLALSLSLILNKNKLPQPKKIILLSPWLDVSLRNPEIDRLEEKDVMLSRGKLKSAGELYAGDADTCHPLVSPIYSDLTNLPETHIFTGDHDLLYADAKKLRVMADESGLNINFYEYEEMMHVWMLFPIPEAKKAMIQVKQILENG